MNEQIMEFIASNNGMLNTEEARQKNIILKRLERLEKDELIERISVSKYNDNFRVMIIKGSN